MLRLSLLTYFLGAITVSLGRPVWVIGLCVLTAAIYLYGRIKSHV